MPSATAQFQGDAARAVLKGLSTAGVEIIARARSPHASDCSCDPNHDWWAMPMSHCRCVRVCRLRVQRGADWLLVFGDCQEGSTVRLSGPYTHDTPLQYGGGFWSRVTV